MCVQELWSDYQLCTVFELVSYHIMKSLSSVSSRFLPEFCSCEKCGVPLNVLMP